MGVQLGIMIANLLMVAVICFQLRYMSHSRKTEDMFTLMEFLHRPPFRKARMAVLVDEWPVNFADYQPVHKSVAWAVCSSFDFAGLMVYRGLVDDKDFYNYWAIPIVALARKLDAFVVAQHFTGDAGGDFKGEDYWPYYDILVKEARKRLSQVRAAIIADREKLAGNRKTRRDYFWDYIGKVRKNLEVLWSKLQARRPRGRRR